MYIEYKPCGIFEGLSHPQYFEDISPDTFAQPEELVDIIKKPKFSNFMETMETISIIFYTGSTY